MSCMAISMAFRPRCARGCMCSDALSPHLQHEQAFLGYTRGQVGRLAHQGRRYIREMRTQGFEAVVGTSRFPRRSSVLP